MTDVNWVLLVAVALVVGLIGLCLWLAATDVATPLRDRAVPGVTSGSRRRGRDRSARPSRSEVTGDGSPRRRVVAVVVNPTKFDDPDAIRAQLEVIAQAHEHDLMWLPTTAEDPGTGQAKQALGADADLICALGGDGTVRTVGAALAGSNTPMGLLPAGTGNLLARNLELPTDLEPALITALTGRNSQIDTCTLRLVRAPGQDAAEESPAEREDAEEHLFLVMAGMGFDAEVMANAPEALKARMGWPAYLISGMKHLRGDGFEAKVRYEGESTFTRRVRSIVVGNVGKLQGGVALLPEAEHDDGVLDTVLIAPRGVAEWPAVVLQIASRRRIGHQRVEWHSSTSIAVTTDVPVEVEVDGDALGEAVEFSVRVNPRDLLVRVASPAGHTTGRA